MQSGVGIDDGLRLAPADQRTLVQEAARLGYDSIWRPASAAGRSAFHSCVQWWQASTEVVPDGLRMGISVVPFPAWRITTLAAEAASVGELTNGRFVLGIGLGGYASSGFRRQLGLDDLPPVSFTRDFTRALRALAARRDGRHRWGRGQPARCEARACGADGARVPGRAGSADAARGRAGL